MRQLRAKLNVPARGRQQGVAHAVVSAAARRGVSVFLMLVLALQGTAALMQRLKPAHYHLQVTSQPGYGQSHGDAHTHAPHSGRGEGHAHAGVDRERSREHGRRHEHRSIPAGEPSTDAAETSAHTSTHRHAAIDRHAHARDDRSVVIVSDVDPAEPARWSGKQSFDGFVLALPPGVLLTGRDGRDRWIAAIAPGHPSHRPRPPERPPRFN